jgi:hypothetical protein
LLSEDGGLALVGTALNQSYHYQQIEFQEIFRRFCRPNSTDPDVRAFRAACLRQDVPQYLLDDATAWEIEPERTMGGGNLSLEMQIADWLMTNRQAFDPEPQRTILRKASLAYTGDPDLALELVPEEPVKVSPSMREAAHIASDLLAGITVEPMTGENHMEIIETMLRIMAERVNFGLQAGGMVEPKELSGLQAIGQHISQRIEMFAEDPQQKERVRQYGDLLGKLMNHVKAFQQRLQQAMQAQAKKNGQGQQGPDPKDAAKVQGMMMQAQTKQQIAQQSAAQRTAQRQVQHELKLRQQMEDHQLKLQQEMTQHGADLAKTDLEAASNIRRNRLKATDEE